MCGILYEIYVKMVVDIGFWRACSSPTGAVRRTTVPCSSEQY